VAFCGTTLNKAELGTRVGRSAREPLTLRLVASASDSVAWAGVGYAAATDTLVSVGTGTATAGRSTDGGETWGTSTLPASQNWRAVAFAPTLGASGRWVAVSQTGTNRVAYSDDGGQTWTARSAAAANTWWWVHWSTRLAKFVALSQSGAGNRVMTSSDGLTWSIGSIADSTWNQIAENSTTLVALAEAGATYCASSTDATTWTPRTLPSLTGTDTFWRGIFWAESLGLFVAFAASSSTSLITGVAYSADGATWTSGTPHDYNGQGASTSVRGLVRAAWGADIAVGLIPGSTTGAPSAYTQDGRHTFPLRPPTGVADQRWASCTYDSTRRRFVAVANAGTGNRAMIGAP
jgi:hypothetical protein